MAKVLSSTAMSRSADFARTYHHVVVPHDVTIEDILRPGFWAHHTARLNKHDIVDVITEDGGIDVQLRVTGKAIGLVEMRPLRIWLRDEPATEAEDEDAPAPLGVPEGYVVNHAPKTGWRVLTKEPPAEISRNHATKLDAINAAIEHAAKANGAQAAA